MKKIYQCLRPKIEIEAPYNVVLSFGSGAKTVLFSDETVSLCEDFRTLDEQRATIAWYVDQLGGKVAWK